MIEKCKNEMWEIKCEELDEHMSGTKVLRRMNNQKIF